MNKEKIAFVKHLEGMFFDELLDMTPPFIKRSEKEHCSSCGTQTGEAKTKMFQFNLWKKHTGGYGVAFRNANSSYSFFGESNTIALKTALHWLFDEGYVQIITLNNREGYVIHTTPIK